MTEEPTMTDRAKEIAGKLTEAQRAALSDRAATPIPSMGPQGYDTFVLGFAHGRSAKALHSMGLASLPFAPQVLTPLGLEVRSILQGEIDG